MLRIMIKRAAYPRYALARFMATEGENRPIVSKTSTRTKEEKKQDSFEVIEHERRKEKRDLIIKQGLAQHAGPMAFYKERSIFLCTCGLSRKGTLCDRSHLRVEHYAPKKYRVGDVDIKEFPEMLLCKCGKSRKHPLCDEQTCLIKFSANK